MKRPAPLRLLCAAALALCLQASSLQAANPEDLTFQSKVDSSPQRYVTLTPPGFDPAKPYDLLVALHGHGADRWQFIVDPRAECQAMRDVAARFGLLLISPDYRARTSWMGPHAEQDVLQLIADLKERHKIGRVFIAGGSMGGTGALIFTALHPDLIAGVCALNPTANLLEYEKFQDAIQASFGGTKTELPGVYKERSPELWPERFTMPVAITTGGKDHLVPPESALRLAAVLKAANRKVLSLHRESVGHSTNYADTAEALEFVLVGAGLTPSAAPAQPAPDDATALVEEARLLREKLAALPPVAPDF